MRCLVLLLILTTAHASDLHLCVVTARRGRSYLGDVVAGLQQQGANFTVVDVDNSTLPSVGAVRLDWRPRVCYPGYVSCPVQQQALDVMRALETCTARGAGSKWIGLVEDDMLICDKAIVTMESVLGKLYRFKTARFAKFSRAVVFPAANIAPYTAFVRAHVDETPYDLLLNHDWAAGIDYIHHQSLFAHKGLVSTVVERNDPKFIAAHGRMRDEACGSPLVG